MFSSSFLPYLVQLLHCLLSFSVDYDVGPTTTHEFIDNLHHQSLLSCVLLSLSGFFPFLFLKLIVCFDRQCAEKVFKVIDDYVRVFVVFTL